MLTKNRRISYMRPQWMNAPSLTLQKALSICLRKLKTVIDTRLPLTTGQADVRHRRVKKDAVYLHVAAWTPHESTSTVPHVKDESANEDLASEPAGDHWDYLDGDGMVLISGNHCLITPSGMRVQSIERYLRSLIEHAREKGADLPEDMDKFGLVPIANNVVAEQIRQGGAKKIDINVGQYLETAREGTELVSETIFHKLSRQVLELILENDEDRQKIAEAENVNARLSIRLDTRRRGLTPSDLVPLVEALDNDSEDEDDYVIETESGERIKKGRLILSKVVSIEAFEKTVHHNAAWELMRDYFNELDERGALEE